MTADELSVYEDYYDTLIREHNKVFGASKEALRIAKGKLLDPDFDRKENAAFKSALKNIQIVEL